MEPECKYVVYETEMLLKQRDERYEEAREHENSDLEGEVFDSLEDATAYLTKLVEAWEQPYEVIHTKRGLDTVAFQAAWIDKEDYDEDGFINDEPETVKYVDSLPDKVREAASKHMHEYWDFLDYKRDHYGHIEVVSPPDGKREQTKE